MIVVAGEALIDLVSEPDGRYRAVPGGSPANVAVGLARLGAPTQLLARIGAGRFGQIVRTHLASNGVGMTHAVEAREPTTLAVVSLDDAGLPSYDFYVD
ncbi:MAG: PfkB family carbohydrate kinase, partial [Jiangellaceae bacterium]